MPTRDPEADRKTASEALATLRQRVDEHFDRAVARTPAGFACRLGCSGCCTPRFSVFEVEAAPIRRTLAELARREPQRRQRIREQAADAPHCALLLDGQCSVYEERPLICRSHGLPIVVRDEHGNASIDHCPLNFQEVQAPPPSRLDLSAVNQPLAVIATLWDGQGNRVELAALAGADDSVPD